MKNIVFSGSLLIILTSFCYINKQAKNPGLICVLTSDKITYKIGQVPKLEVRLINVSNKDIYLIGSLDGSDLQWRMPYCYYSIDKPKPDTLIFPRCGNTNPIRVEDFKMVKPKEEFNPFESIDGFGFFGDYTTTQKETFRNSGVYKIQFHYTTNSGNIEKFLGNFRQWKRGSDSLKLKSFFARVPKGDIISNEIEIKIEE